MRVICSCHPLLRFGLARCHRALLVFLVPVRVPWHSQGKRGIVARATVASLAQGFIQDFSKRGGGGGGGGTIWHPPPTRKQCLLPMF